MASRTVGVEEELLVVDPRTSSVTSRAREALKVHADHDDGGELDKELFRHQLELRTDPVRDIDDLQRQVVAARRTAAGAAQAVDLAVAACASVPLGVEEPEVTSDDRYRDMVATFGRPGTPRG